VLPAGTWPLRLDSRQSILEGTTSVSVDPNLADVHLDLRVRKMPSIEGIVLDEDA
jgi:hypothetical protein